MYIIAHITSSNIINIYIYIYDDESYNYNWAYSWIFDTFPYPIAVSHRLLHGRLRHPGRGIEAAVPAVAVEAGAGGFLRPAVEGLFSNPQAKYGFQRKYRIVSKQVGL